MHQSQNDITADEALEFIQTNPDIAIIDVRSEDEYDDEHIQGAINIDYNQEHLRDKLAEFNKNEIYLVYCRSGNRSGKAVDIMLELGFKHALNIQGGLIACKNKDIHLTR